MKKISFIFPAFLLLFNTVTGQTEKKEIGNLVCENIPPIPPALIEKMNQYQNIRSAAFADWSSDGKSILMATRFGDVAQLHLIDHPGGARKQITFFKEPITSGKFCPEETTQRFTFVKDVGGNEFAQLYLYDVSTGKYEMISDGGRTQNSLPVWSNGGKQFIVVSTRRNGKDYYLYLSNLATPKESKIILEKGGSWSVSDWSPDDKNVLVEHFVSSTSSHFYILNIQAGTLDEIAPSKEDISFGKGIWSADGKGIFIINDQGSEFLTLKYYDIATKKFTDISSAIPWDITGMDANKDRTKIIFSANEDGLSKLYLLDASTKKFQPLKDLPVGVISGIHFNPKNNEIGMTINTPQSPGDIYSYDLNASKLIRWTYSEVGGLNSSAFTVPTLIGFETFDKVNGRPRKIPAFYFKPKNATGKLPVIINIHGGPEAQFLPNFNSFVSYLTNELGVAVIAPNVRGSSGYGKTYLKLDNDFQREESVKDIGALLDWIAKQPELDASRVAVYGGSYGGYMTLASLVHYNDRLKCGIDVVGISNFVTFLKNTEDYRKDLRRVEYGDERDPKMNEFLTKISPANRVDKITKPLFIIQGLNDPRVPVTEAEQMKQKIRDQKGDVWYLLAKDEGHGFKKKINLDYQQWSIVLFFQEKLVK
ncbi:MAG: alpha/beta fold hydrolase [Bacteroidota bacterium]